jgi:hypothetical protein
MKISTICILLFALAGCGTVKGTASGFLDGASQDLGNLSKLIRNEKE